MILTCDENNTCNKISSILYRLLLKLHVLDAYTSPWLKFVKDTLNNIGLSGIWNSQSLPASRKCFRQSIKVRLRDQFIHQWITEINESGKCIIYRTYKTTFTFENYLISSPRRLKIIFTKFRCRNHRLPIGTGCRERVLRDTRVCTKCDIAPKNIGDEFHYLFVCDFFKTERIEHLLKQYHTSPSTLKLHTLLNITSGNVLRNLCTFIYIIMNSF